MATGETSAQLVVVGSSAGGIDALQTLVASLPKNFPAPMLIAQHLDPRRPSHLAEILGRRSTLPVQTIHDREALVPGKVFVIPANQHVAINDGYITVNPDLDGSRPMPSINLLFAGAAEAYGEGLIAVILTGTGSDGAAGALEVKKAGGAVVIQNPVTAPYPSMPQSLAPTAVDFIANVEDMGPLLYDLLTGASPLTQASETRALRAFLTHVHDQSGLDFGNYKPATILRRLKRRMVATDSQSLDSYLRFLDQHPDEYQRLISTFLIKVTEFFRDRELFDTLRNETLPRLIDDARKRSKQLRIWSAGCATGEEAYSIAMLVADALGDELDQFSVRVFATDLDANAIAFARRGVYPGAALNMAPRELVERYFVRTDDEYEVNKRVRSLVVFGQHDLGQRAPFPHIDLVLCRNVLIYFGAELQRRVLQLFAYSLRNSGILVLGKAETTSPLTDYFVPVNSLLRIYRRYGEQLLLPAGQINGQVPLQSTHLITNKSSLPSSPARIPPNTIRTRTSIERLGDTMLGLPIGIAIVDRHYDVQTINAAALRLLEIHRAAVGEDLLHLVENVPQKPLRAVIDATFRGFSESEREVTLSVDSETGERRAIHVHAYPQTSQDDEDMAEAAVLVITEVSDLDNQQTPANTTSDSGSGDAHAGAAPTSLEEISARQQVEIDRLQEQVQRLTTTNRELREANDELTRTNLDLRQSNEEFLVTTEELQAASEEVETLNEELQASNEELETLNEELQATVEELNASNDDIEARSRELQELASHLDDQRRISETERARLEAILVNMGDAVLVVDSQGKIAHANAAYARMFNGTEAILQPEDEQGIPLPPEATPQRRTASGESFSMVFTLPNEQGGRRWFEANGQPIIQGDGQESGVIVIRDITDRSLRRLQSEFLAQAAHELRTPLTSAQAALQALARHREKASAQSIERNVTIALNQVKRLGLLVSDLVDIARLQNGKLHLQLVTIDLAQVVTKAVDAMQMGMKQRIKLTVEDQPLLIRGDGLRLEQVIDNLLNNAAKYVPKSERIDVIVRRNGEAAEIAVHDDGPGIPEETAAQVFSRFYQSPQAQEASQSGMGLGLFIARGLIVAQGGDIIVSSKSGEGATFVIRIPLSPETDTSADDMPVA